MRIQSDPVVVLEQKGSTWPYPLKFTFGTGQVADEFLVHMKIEMTKEMKEIRKVVSEGEEFLKLVKLELDEE